MKCPLCVETDLVMTERQGVEIDYCPKCRGVWLDRGELDKILERSASMTNPVVPPTQTSVVQEGPYRQHAPYKHGEHPYDRRRKSWVSELFD